MITRFSNFNQASSVSLAFKIIGMSFRNYSTFFQLVFGVNAVQSASLLKIKKADLTGIQAVSNNTAESLFVALLLQMFAFNNNNNKNLNTYKWGSNVNNNILTHTLILELFNQLVALNTYEIPEPDNIVNPIDY